MKKIPIRSRIFIAIEGQGERAFVKLLQEFSDKLGLSLTLDAHVLNGGGYQKMLNSAIKKRQQVKKQKNPDKLAIIIVDSDRSENNDDGWSISKLKQEASKKGFFLFAQNPNQEGLLIKLFPGNENKKISKNHINTELQKIWPDYKKPINFYKLKNKFSLEDLTRASSVNADLKNLMIKIGLIQ